MLSRSLLGVTKNRTTIGRLGKEGTANKTRRRVIHSQNWEQYNNQVVVGKNTARTTHNPTQKKHNKHTHTEHTTKSWKKTTPHHNNKRTTIDRYLTWLIMGHSTNKYIHHTCISRSIPNWLDWWWSFNKLSDQHKYIHHTYIHTSHQHHIIIYSQAR